MKLRPRAPFFFALTAAALALAAPRQARAGAAADELVREARAHEAAHEDDVAVRRYTDALRLEPSNSAAYLGLGAARIRMGEPREADRVFTLALTNLPDLHRAYEGRAHARWAMGRHDDAEQDLETFAALENESDEPALRELARWYGADGRAPAQLSAWRRLLAIAVATSDAPLEREARLSVLALTILVGPADPAASPAGTPADATRRALARIARRGG